MSGNKIDGLGMHTIEVTFADAPIAGSPFRCEVVDPKRVKIIAPTTPLVLRQEANFRCEFRAESLRPRL